jgi:hypothetical protein
LTCQPWLKQQLMRATIPPQRPLARDPPQLNRSVTSSPAISELVPLG